MRWLLCSLLVCLCLCSELTASTRGRVHPVYRSVSRGYVSPYVTFYDTRLIPRGPNTYLDPLTRRYIYVDSGEVTPEWSNKPINVGDGFSPQPADPADPKQYKFDGHTITITPLK